LDEHARSQKLGGIKLSAVFQQYIKQIVQEIDGSELDKEDIMEELIIHLQLTSEQYVAAGYDDKEAEKMAINQFGKSKEIGKQMQEAMFPFRKLMFLILAIASFIYSYTVYSMQLFTEGNAHIGWLVLSVMTSSLLLLFVLRIFPFLDRRISLNSALILHVFIYGYGIFLASSLDNFTSIILTYFSWSIVLLTFVLIYRTTIYDYQNGTTEIVGRTKKVIHYLNITLGIVIIIATLFFIWGILAFGDGLFTIGMLFIPVPFIIWFVTYIVQIKLVHAKRIVGAFIVAVIPIFLVVSFIIWWFA